MHVQITTPSHARPVAMGDGRAGGAEAALPLEGRGAVIIGFRGCMGSGDVADGAPEVAAAAPPTPAERTRRRGG